MGRRKLRRDYWPLGLTLTLILPFVACAPETEGPVGAESAGAYRFPREAGTTPDGYPLPLAGKPITKTPVISKAGVSVKEYPEHYIPGQESLAENEMRITACGSWGPAPLRIGQGASCLLVELGNDDVFIFDVGGGTVGNLFALGVHPARLDKVFITHFHLDHVGGIFPLFDAMGWARNTPLHVWGSSGYTPELGITAFTRNIRAAAEWHIQNKQSILPKAGMTLVPHEVDYTKFSPEHPRELAYDETVGLPRAWREGSSRLILVLRFACVHELVLSPQQESQERRPDPNHPLRTDDLEAANLVSDRPDRLRPRRSGPTVESRHPRNVPYDRQRRAQESRSKLRCRRLPVLGAQAPVENDSDSLAPVSRQDHRPTRCCAGIHVNLPRLPSP
jgi:hypothetical protein